MTNEINDNDNDYIDYDIHSKYCTYASEESPDKIAFNGRCIIYIKADGFFAINGFVIVCYIIGYICHSLI